MNNIMKHHRVSYNLETFGILRQLKHKYPGITCIRIHQPMSFNYRYDHEWTIIARLDHIKSIVNSTAYQNSLRALPEKGGTVVVPDPYKKYRKREWYSTLNKWRQKSIGR